MVTNMNKRLLPVSALILTVLSSCNNNLETVPAVNGAFNKAAAATASSSLQGNFVGEGWETIDNTVAIRQLSDGASEAYVNYELLTQDSFEKLVAISGSDVQNSRAAQ